MLCCLVCINWWRKRPSGEWVGVLQGLLWILTQNETSIDYQVVNPSLNGDEKKEEKKKYEDILKDYFQVHVNLEKLYSEWSNADENFCKVAKDYQGVRMLQQDPVENLFSFICSSNNNIQRFGLCLIFRVLEIFETCSVKLWLFQNIWNDWKNVRHLWHTLTPTWWGFILQFPHNWSTCWSRCRKQVASNGIWLPSQIYSAISSQDSTEWRTRVAYEFTNTALQRSKICTDNTSWHWS